MKLGVLYYYPELKTYIFRVNYLQGQRPLSRKIKTMSPGKSEGSNANDEVSRLNRECDTHFCHTSVSHPGLHYITLQYTTNSTTNHSALHMCTKVLLTSR